MKDYIADILSKANFAISQISVKSALNPILWLCGLASVICLVLAHYDHSALRWIYMIIGCMPIIIACIGFIYLLFKNPDYLRSETFQVQKISLELMGEKGIAFTEIQVRALKALTNPNADSNALNEEEK